MMVDSSVEWARMGYQRALEDLKKWIKKESFSICLKCNTRWDGLIKKCASCSARLIQDSYGTEIEWCINSEELLQKMESLILERDIDNSNLSDELKKKLKDLMWEISKKDVQKMLSKLIKELEE